MRSIPVFVLVIALFSCRNKNVPDVSNIDVQLTTQRFEKELFNINTPDTAAAIEKIIAKYPGFGENFLSSILGLDPKWPADTTIFYIKGFLAYNRNVYDTAEKIFRDFTPYEKDIHRSLQFVKYYFPAYKLPRKIITYIGPVDGFADILDDDALIVGLHAHLGKDFPLYKSTLVQETYPAYISNRFEPEYISVNCMKNIVGDMFPEKNEDKTLVVQMVENGKRLFVLSKLLPEQPEYRLIGYTEKQMKDCYNHETAIWDLFVQNNFLQTSDNNLTKNYVTEGPKTQELGEGAPGNIGSFAGWQIVKKYMKKNPETTLQQLMELPAEKLFAAAKYKP